MPCYSPLKGYRSRSLNENGKRPIVFKPDQGYIDMPVTLPCGRCFGCRLEHSRQWAVRCVHEAQMHEHNSFITLTYDDAHLPLDKSVHKEELQKFFKRQRKLIGPFRYFACGEYGSQKNRPHYHAIIFGYDYPDKTLLTVKNGNQLYTSDTLSKAWKLGFHTIGHVTFESAAYVARYVMKKHKHDKREPETAVDMHNAITDRETGEIYEIEPEFCLMSRGSKKSGTRGIGYTWLEQFKQDTDKDFITINGTVMSLPRYYDSLLEEKNPEEMLERKQTRLKNFDKENNTYERLIVRETVKKAQTSLLSRNLEEIQNDS